MEKKLNEAHFQKLIMERQQQTNSLDKLSDYGLDLWDSKIIEYGNKLFDEILGLYFTDEGAEWIFWWLYEKNGNSNINCFDSDHNEIPTETIHDLWQIVKNYLR
jgi:hypothetical protein